MARSYYRRRSPAKTILVSAIAILSLSGAVYYFFIKDFEIKQEKKIETIKFIYSDCGTKPAE